MDWLSAKIRRDYRYDYTSWLPDEAYDLNSDNVVDLKDHRVWVKDLKFTWYGDANLNDAFESGDLVRVFIAGKYGRDDKAGWAEGDWDGDGLFAGSDLETASVDGGYEQGMWADAVAVPEPVTLALLVSAAASLFFVYAPWCK